MKEQEQNIRNKQLYKFASFKRYIKIHVPDFAFKHDDNNIGKDKFVGRELQIRRLYTWLTSDSKSGSYLVTGYRGMGKSLLVKRVIDMISREPKAYKEVGFQIAKILTLIAFFFGIAIDQKIFPYKWMITAVLASLAIIIVTFLEISKRINYILFEHSVHKVPLYHIFNKDMIAKIWMRNRDRRSRKYSKIAITVNLGQEVLNERDVLSLIAHSIREKYYKFVHNTQNRPIINFIFVIGCGLSSFFATKCLIIPVMKDICNYIMNNNLDLTKSWITAAIIGIAKLFDRILSSTSPGHVEIRYIVLLALLYMCFYILTFKLLKTILKKIPYFSIPYNSLDRLDSLCERVASSLNEEKGTHPQYSSSFFNFSFGKAGKSKTTPIATVRELEQELMGIVNSINGEDCPVRYCAQFIIIFDELDKIANIHKKGSIEPDESDEEAIPSFEASLRGFTEAMPYEERKQSVLRLLANMKLFITSVKAKCVFISGHELFDASLADLSDREFAISSIFNGVLNVSSFLSPEHEETDVSSMTEVYLATMLLPESYIKSRFQSKADKESSHLPWSFFKEIIIYYLVKITSFWPVFSHKSYLKQKVKENILTNGVLKDELPSLRWYNQYLMEIHILNNEETYSEEEIKEREYEIRHVMEFLRNFCVYLSHISNGSPKKIATYFEKYVRVNYDTIKQFDWYDEIEVGQPTEDDVRKQCVLYFDPDSQKLVNFIHYIAAPVMNAITNEVSHYGDKLLVSSSFILDQIYKYHGKGFSWRNLEQMPELLNTNKNPELRDSLASIMEFLLQTHITTISSSIFQYKFHKQIAEEISMLSKTSEEAAAIFNFTLNESETVKRYNARLLWNYFNLMKQTKERRQRERYCVVLERLHENQGDIYFSEEDYYRAIHEYRSALQYIDEGKISPKNLIAYLKCSLKIGMSYEYRHTFENAYMVYCQIINKLIQLRWVDEKELGLDFTMRLTYDWRVKQDVLVNGESLKDWFSNESNEIIRKQFNTGLYEDIIKENEFSPKYSIDSDKTISGLAKNFTPEKSDILLRLTAFEDIKFIYQAIITKLFVIEKMESSGITQSSIDAAEAEFITLYSTVNYSEKFILAADFFSKLASILYYKNAVVSASPIVNIVSALNFYDIDVMALIDDYCYKDNKEYNDNAIRIKDDIVRVLSFFNFNEIKNNRNKIDKAEKDPFFKTLYDVIICDESIKNRLSTYCKNDDSELTRSLNNIKGYFSYLDTNKIGGINLQLGKLIDCFERRINLTNKGLKLPCSACKYANRGLSILMEQLFDFEDDNEDKKYESRVVKLISYSSHSKLHKLRPEIVSQLAFSSEQMADIMMSCAYTPDNNNNQESQENDTKAIISDNIGFETIDLLCELTHPENIYNQNRENVIKDFENKLEENGNKKKPFGKLNRALLYYWAACRYYDIASMHYEAVHCIWRITCVIEKYLSVLLDNNLDVESFIIKAKTENKLIKLLSQLFTQASRIVSRQYDNYNSVEIHELKWLLHFEHIDYIDLTQLTQFPNLQSVFLSIVNSNLIINDLRIKQIKPGQGNQVDVKKYVDEKNDYIKKMYLWLVRNRHNRTFKSDVELNCLKAKLNYFIFDSIVGVSDIRKEYFDFKAFRPMADMHTKFYEHLMQLLDDSPTFFENTLFNNLISLQSRLDILDFIIDDSITCLCNIVNTLPPHNQFSTFPNSFIANVYSNLWEWSKYYELFYNAYFYYRHFLVGNNVAMEKMNRYTSDNSIFKRLAEKLSTKSIICKDDFGYRYSKLNMNLRHDVDDATIHHIYINYSAEMAIKYYRAARGINSEGLEYKNLINTMYILDDDLRNDTCQSNLADERYLLNSGMINSNRLKMQGIYKKSKTNMIDSFENYEDMSGNDQYSQLRERFADSLYSNTEY